MRKCTFMIFALVVFVLMVCQAFVAVNYISQVANVQVLSKIVEYLQTYPEVHDSLLFFGKVANVTLFIMIVAFTLVGISNIVLRAVIALPVITFIIVALTLT